MAIEKPMCARLDDMKGNEYTYNDRVVTVLSYMFIDGGKEVEIYLNSGETIYTNYATLPKVLDKFHPIAEQARILQKQADNRINVCSGDIVSEIRDTLLAQLREIRENPSKEVIAQSKAVNDTVNQFNQLARTELDFKRMAMQMRKS